MMDFFFHICAVIKKQEPMKKALSLFIIALVTYSINAQEKETETKKNSKNPWVVQTMLETKAYDDSLTKMTLHAVEFTVDTVKEMDEIDWDDIFGVFQENAARIPLKWRLC